MVLRSAVLLLGVWVSLGCKSQLETGYDYRPLNSTASQRRGYYAAPYSPEAQAAEATDPDQYRSSRPSY